MRESLNGKGKGNINYFLGAYSFSDSRLRAPWTLTWDNGVLVSAWPVHQFMGSLGHFFFSFASLSKKWNNVYISYFNYQKWLLSLPFPFFLSPSASFCYFFFFLKTFHNLDILMLHMPNYPFLWSFLLSLFQFLILFLHLNIEAL